MSNEQVIHDLYEAFARKDHAAMAACYHDSATFGDPVFLQLDADQTRAMWKMFCIGGSDLTVTHSDVAASGDTGSARWQAHYTFAPTKRPVQNKITASFSFKDGLIIEHRDSFDLYAWTRMALGPLGTFLGWTPIVRGQVRGQAAKQLRRSMGDATKG